MASNSPPGSQQKTVVSSSVMTGNNATISAANSLHEYDPHGTTLLLQQQQTIASVVDYYQNPGAIYNQIQNSSHYGNAPEHHVASNDLLATQQYLQNLRLGDGDPNSQLLDGVGSEYSDYLQQQQHYHGGHPMHAHLGAGDYNDVGAATAMTTTTTTSTANIVEDVDLDMAGMGGMMDLKEDAYGNYYAPGAVGPNMVPAHYHHHYQPQYLVQYGTVGAHQQLDSGENIPGPGGGGGGGSGGGGGGGGRSGGEGSDGTRWRNPNLVEVINFLKSPNNLIKANAAAYLQHLCYMDDPNKQKTRQLGGIPPLIELMKNDNFIVYRNALGALRNLSYGRQNDENKRQIKNYNGISELMSLLVKLNGRASMHHEEDPQMGGGGRKQLTPAMEMEIKELITGIVWNMSSCEDIKRTIIDDSLAAIVQLIIIPYSGILAPNSSAQAALIFANMPGQGQNPTSDSYLATVFRNATGIIRNISSAGEYARQKLRETPLLINTLVHIIKCGIERQNIGNKIIENCVCILRNLSYRLQEIEDPNYDKMPIPLSNITGNSNSGEFLNQSGQFQNCNGSAGGAGQGAAGSSNSGGSSSSSSHLGCFGVSKKKKSQKADKNSGSSGGDDKSNKAGGGAGQAAGNQDGHVGGGGVPGDRPANKNYELLYQPELIQFYLQLLQSCSNPETLEAAAGAIQNLAACYWQPSIEIRAAVRKEKGLPILVELLRMEVDRVVCAVATSLRNLAIDQRNKELIGKYAMRDLIQKLPTGNVSHDQGTSDDTIAAVLATLNEVIKKNCEFCRSLLDNGGVDRLMIIVKQKKQNYTPRVLKFTGQLLYTMWQHQDLRDAYKKYGWKESDFVHLHQSSASNTLAKSKASSSSSSSNHQQQQQHQQQQMAHHQQQSPNSPPSVQNSGTYGAAGMGMNTLNRPMASQGGTRYEDRTIKRQNGGQVARSISSNNSNYHLAAAPQQRNGGMTNEEMMHLNEMMMHQQMASNYQEILTAGGPGAMLYQQQQQHQGQGGGDLMPQVSQSGSISHY